MTTPPPDPTPEPTTALTAALEAASLPRLGPSLALYPAPLGDCGGCTLEFQMLRSAAYGLAQHGLTVLDTPVGADILLVTGAMTRSLAGPLRRALDAMAEPRWVVAIGDCAMDGGPFAASPVILGGAQAAIPIDLAVPGCPPNPAVILEALRTLLAVNATPPTA